MAAISMDPRARTVAAGPKRAASRWQRAMFAAALFLGAAGFVGAAPSGAAAQTPVISPNDAVVTGFSGVRAVPGGAPGTGEGLIIDTDGPAVEILQLDPLGPADARQLPSRRRFAVPAGQVGQVFGIALDDQNPPNLYLAATSAYGLSLVGPDGAHLRAGAPGARFMPGQFGSAPGGGPASVWRVDGTTGQVALFANVAVPGLANGAAALGGIAFDRASRQIFVADRATGLVQRFGLDGVARGVFDHGAQGRVAAGLPAVAAQAAPVSIESPAFNTEDPATWGYADPARRVGGLGTHGGRLFYAVAEGPQVWSVGISANGDFAGDPRLEIDVPALAAGVEITDITFDPSGILYVAERGATTGAYDYRALAQAGQSRVMRFRPEREQDGTTTWSPVGEEYAIGFPPDFSNGNGGIAIGNAEEGPCGTLLWSTGERLRQSADPAERARLSATGFLDLDGLQGNATRLVRPDNSPPLAAWYVDYDDRAGDPEARGLMGDVEIWRVCQRAAAAPPPPPPPLYVMPPAPPPAVMLDCPFGSIFVDGACLLPPRCPPGTRFYGGECIYDACPPGLMMLRGTCVPPPQVCPPWTYYARGRCVPIGCPGGLTRLPNGYCGCPPGLAYFNGRCVPPNNCPPYMRPLPGGVCGCPQGERFDGRRCVPWQCPPGLAFFNGRCVPPPNTCPPNTVFVQGRCYPQQGDRCPPGTIRRDGTCLPLVGPVPPPPGGPCPAGLTLFNGQCFMPPRGDHCPPGTLRQGNICMPMMRPGGGPGLVPGPGPTPIPGPIPGTGPGRGPGPGPVVACGAGQILVNGQCLDRAQGGRCPPGLVRAGQACVPPGQPPLVTPAVPPGQPVPPVPPGRPGRPPVVTPAVPPGQPVPPVPPGRPGRPPVVTPAVPPGQPVPPVPPGGPGRPPVVTPAVPPGQPVPPVPPGGPGRPPVVTPAVPPGQPVPPVPPGRPGRPPVVTPAVPPGQPVPPVPPGRPGRPPVVTPAVPPGQPVRPVPPGGAGKPPVVAPAVPPGRPPAASQVKPQTVRPPQVQPQVQPQPQRPQPAQVPPKPQSVQPRPVPAAPPQPKPVVQPRPEQPRPVQPRPVPPRPAQPPAAQPQKPPQQQPARGACPPGQVLKGGNCVKPM